jgi:hypothetical protein
MRWDEACDLRLVAPGTHGAEKGTRLIAVEVSDAIAIDFASKWRRWGVPGNAKARRSGMGDDVDGRSRRLGIGDSRGDPAPGRLDPITTAAANPALDGLTLSKPLPVVSVALYVSVPPVPLPNSAVLEVVAISAIDGIPCDDDAAGRRNCSEVCRRG